MYSFPEDFNDDYSFSDFFPSVGTPHDPYHDPSSGSWTDFIVVSLIVFACYAYEKWQHYNRTYERIRKEEKNKLEKIRGTKSWGDPTTLGCETDREYLNKQLKKWLRKWAVFKTSRNNGLFTWIFKTLLKRLVIWYLGTETEKTIRVQTHLEEYIRNQIRLELYTKQELIDWDFNCFIDKKEEYPMDWWIEDNTNTEELMEERVLSALNKVWQHNRNGVLLEKLQENDAQQYKIYSDLVGHAKHVKYIKSAIYHITLDARHFFSDLLYKHKGNKMLEYLTERTSGEMNVMLFPESPKYENYSLEELKDIYEPLKDSDRFLWTWLYDFEKRWNNKIKNNDNSIQVY